MFFGSNIIRIKNVWRREDIEMTKVIMHGCNGRMGQVICGLIAEDDKIEVVAGVDISNHISNYFPIISP